MTDAPPPSFDFTKWTHEMKREDFQRSSEWHISHVDKSNEAAIKAADGALRAGLLINGGAAVSVLAFIGSLANKALIAIPQLSGVANSLKFFAYGVAAAVVGLGLSYLTHFFEACYYVSMKWDPDTSSMGPGPNTKAYFWVRTAVHALAVIAFFACIACFIFGMLSVRAAIDRLGTGVDIKSSADPGGTLLTVKIGVFALTVIGLALTGLGAWLAARAVILTEDDAITVGVSRWGSRDFSREDFLKLPAVQNLLKQSRAARSGLLFVTVGSLIQVVAAVVGLLG
jgi:hypothetical protein